MSKHPCVYLSFLGHRRTFHPVALLQRGRVAVNMAEYCRGETPQRGGSRHPWGLFCLGLFSSTPCGAPYAPTVTAVNPTLLAIPQCPHGRNVCLRSFALSSCVCDSDRCFHPIAGCFIIAPGVDEVIHPRHSRSVVEEVGIPRIIRHRCAAKEIIDRFPTCHAGHRWYTNLSLGWISITATSLATNFQAAGRRNIPRAW